FLIRKTFCAEGSEKSWGCLKTAGKREPQQIKTTGCAGGFYLGALKYHIFPISLSAIHIDALSFFAHTLI
ncbi:hypothetical protein, partial [Clostridium sp. MSTE9]|uniref:hypothetical protein n=1 Tax=Clostridium sp. (strain MSTE9) TaxID=1105031 RepID=UPI0018C8D2D5